MTSDLPLTLLVQPGPSVESRAITKAAYLTDARRPIVAFEDLRLHADGLRDGTSVPVGSVEFVREAMRVSGIPEPENISYPAALAGFLLRDVKQIRAGSVLGTLFVKPMQTKAFTGFVFDTMRAPEEYSEHDQVQLAGFMSLSADEYVWCSEPVQFASEWRYYVSREGGAVLPGGRILGRARYDPDGLDTAKAPDMAVVEAAVAAMCSSDVCPSDFAVDMGVLEDGRTALVEVNDFWGLGYYPGTAGHQGLTEIAYMEMLQRRWRQLASASRQERPIDTARDRG